MACSFGNLWLRAQEHLGALVERAPALAGGGRLPRCFFPEASCRDGGVPRGKAFPLPRSFPQQVVATSLVAEAQGGRRCWSPGGDVAGRSIAVHPGVHRSSRAEPRGAAAVMALGPGARSPGGVQSSDPEQSEQSRMSWRSFGGSEELSPPLRSSGIAAPRLRAGGCTAGGQQGQGIAGTSSPARAAWPCPDGAILPLQAAAGRSRAQAAQQSPRAGRSALLPRPGTPPPRRAQAAATSVGPVGESQDPASRRWPGAGCG